jgi:hypothetical protein
MKKIVFILICFIACTANAQNGFTTYTTNLTLSGPLKQQTAFTVDNAGNKWFGYRIIPSSTSALIKYDNSTWTAYTNTTTPSFPLCNVTAIASDNTGNIWIGTNIGLIKFDGSSFSTLTTTDGLPSNVITSLEYINNQLYIGTTSGLSRYDGISFTNYNVLSGTLPSDVIYSIKAENQNIIWLGGLDRLVQFNINNSFSITSYQDNVLTAGTGTVNCIQFDSQNNKWIGTTNQGVIRFNGSVFENATTLYETYGSIIPTKVLSIAQGINGGVVFKMQATTGFKGLIELAPNNKVYQYFNNTSAIAPSGDMLLKNGSDILMPSAILNSSILKMYFKFSSLNYTMPLGAINVNNFKTLDVNNVKAGIANRGDMHWDIGGTQNAMYEVPKGSGANSNFVSALWIGGLDNSNLLHGAAQTYRQAGSGGDQFWPGPLDTISASIDTATALNYDKIWKVSYTDINTFIAAFNSGSVVATPDMLTWPAHGTGNNSRNLAPFVDYNNDGLYNPNDGDYPKIKGDQTLYFIFNDKLAAHTNTFASMGVEVQGMAYAYGCPTVVSGKPELSYTTFYDYKIINRSSTNYHDVYVSMFSDVDLGYYADDYIGTNVTDNYGYAYNADANDETISAAVGYGSYIPTQGFNIVKGPIANLNDGIDNNNNGIVDETGEDCKLNKLTYYNNNFAGTPLQTIDPENGQEYYNYMTGFWKDGSPFTCGGNAYGGTTPTSWVYTADTYTNGVCGSTPWYESSVPGDRRLILSAGPFTLNAGQMQEVEYAFVTSFDSSIVGGMAALPKLKSDIQKINTFYNQVNKPNCLQSITIGVSELLKQNDFALFPNPAKSAITISSTINGIVKINYEIVDVLGKVLMQNENTGSDKFSINITALNSGIYFFRLQVNNSVVVKKFVKE